MMLGEFIDLQASKQRFLIVGKGKSGTTWLYMMFEKNVNCLMTSERKLIETPHHNAALLDSLLDEKLFMRWFRSSSYTCAAPDDSGVRYRLCRMISDTLLYNACKSIQPDHLANLDSKTHIGEKIAVNSRQDASKVIENIKQIYPGIKVIHIVRDPRDVSVSAMFHRYRMSKASGKSNLITRYIEAKERNQKVPLIAGLYKFIYCLVDQFRWVGVNEALYTEGQEKFGPDYMVVQYEQLISDAGLTLVKLGAFLNLDLSDEQIQGMISSASFENLSSGRSRGEQRSDSFFRKGISGDWVNHIGSFENWLYRKIHRRVNQTLNLSVRYM